MNDLISLYNNISIHAGRLRMYIYNRPSEPIYIVASMDHSLSLDIPKHIYDILSDKLSFDKILFGEYGESEQFTREDIMNVIVDIRNNKLNKINDN